MENPFSHACYLLGLYTQMKEKTTTSQHIILLNDIACELSFPPDIFVFLIQKKISLFFDESFKKAVSQSLAYM